jgi:glycosyltransferase involved in cell wall biosynthesis
MHVIPHGIDDQRFRMYTNEIEAAQEREMLAKFGVEGCFILHLGTIEPRKNVDSLLRAYESVCTDSSTPPPSLVLAGSAWPGEWERLEPLSRQITDRLSAARVLRLGEVPDALVAPLCRAASAVVYPSFEEGFGLPLLEALACGTPVVTSEGSVMEDIAGTAVIAVDPNDVSSIARGIHIALGEQPEQRTERTRHGQSVSAEYRWARCAEDHAKVYRSLC